MTKKILVLGKNGQIGSALLSHLGDRAIGAGRADVNFLHDDFITELEIFLKDAPLAAVFNAAAYTQVDAAEKEGGQEVWRINALAVAELAAWCHERDLPLIHYSTDYVFGDDGALPHDEKMPPSPINIYGQSKLAGEKAIIDEGGKYLIFRTSWVYDASRNNFFTKLIKRFYEEKECPVVSDQVGGPTYAPQLSMATSAGFAAAAAMPTFPSGLYHICHAGEASRYDFARLLLDRVKVRDRPILCEEIMPVLTRQYILPAQRPLNSRLDCSLAYKVLGIGLPHWQEGLEACIEAYMGNAPL